MSSSHQERIDDVKREAQELVNYILGREAYQCNEHIPTTDEHDGNIKIEICDESMLEGNGETANEEILGHQDYAPLNACSNSMHIDHGQAGGNGFMCLTLQRSLSTLIEQNKAILADNKMIRNTLTNVLEQNSLLLEENLKLKSSMEMQNRLLQDQQKKMDDFQQNMAEDNRKSRDTNFKLFTHFTEEFIQLRNKVEDLLNGPRFVPSAWFVPVLSTPEEILKFDEQIKEDEHIKCQLINKFENQPQNEVRKFISENLKLIFKDDHITSKFSWCQVNNNIPVKDLNLIRLLKDVTLEKIPEVTTSTVETHLKMYFSLAKDRLNKRNKRKIEAVI